MPDITPEAVFAELDIDHLSFSHLNTWGVSPAAWALRYIKGLRTPPNDNMMRGILVEHIIVDHMRSDMPLDDLIKMHIENSDYEFQSEKTLEMIAHMAFNGATALRKIIPAGVVPLVPAGDKGQWLVKHEIAGIPVPLIGFPDIVFSDGTVVEIKTASSAPPGNKPRLAHIQQLAVYMKWLEQHLDSQAGIVKAFIQVPQVKGMILYCLARQRNPVIDCHFNMTDIEPRFHEVEKTAFNLMNFLQLTKAGYDKLGWQSEITLQDAIMAITPCDPDHFYLNDYSREDIARYCNPTFEVETTKADTGLIFAIQETTHENL